LPTNLLLRLAVRFFQGSLQLLLGEDPERVALEFIDADESFVTGPETV
jgi:hypothetical protein